MTTTGLPDRYEQFLALHRPGEPLLFLIPGMSGGPSILASLGFQALATTSSGFAASLWASRRRGQPR